MAHTGSYHDFEASLMSPDEVVSRYICIRIKNALQQTLLVLAVAVHFARRDAHIVPATARRPAAYLSC